MGNVGNDMAEINVQLTNVLHQAQVVAEAGGNLHEFGFQYQPLLMATRNHLRALQVPQNIQFIVDINGNLLILHQIFILLGLPAAIHDGSMSSTQIYVSMNGHGDVADLDDFQDDEEDLPYPVMPITPEKTNDDIFHERKF